MEVEGPIVDETGLDNFLRDTASERARDVRAFKCAFLTALLTRSRSSEGKMTQLSERLDPNLSVTTAEKTLEELDPTEQREKFTGMSGDPRQGNALGDAGGRPLYNDYEPGRRKWGDRWANQVPWKRSRFCAGLFLPVPSVHELGPRPHVGSSFVHG